MSFRRLSDITTLHPYNLPCPACGGKGSTPQQIAEAEGKPAGADGKKKPPKNCQECKGFKNSDGVAVQHDFTFWGTFPGGPKWNATPQWIHVLNQYKLFQEMGLDAGPLSGHLAEDHGKKDSTNPWHDHVRAHGVNPIGPDLEQYAPQLVNSKAASKEDDDFDAWKDELVVASPETAADHVTHMTSPRGEGGHGWSHKQFKETYLTLYNTFLRSGAPVPADIKEVISRSIHEGSGHAAMRVNEPPIAEGYHIHSSRQSHAHFDQHCRKCGRIYGTCPHTIIAGSGTAVSPFDQGRRGLPDADPRYKGPIDVNRIPDPHVDLANDGTSELENRHPVVPVELFENEQSQGDSRKPVNNRPTIVPKNSATDIDPYDNLGEVKVLIPPIPPGKKGQPNGGTFPGNKPFAEHVNNTPEDAKSMNRLVGYKSAMFDPVREVQPSLNSAPAPELSGEKPKRVYPHEVHDGRGSDSQYWDGKKWVRRRPDSDMTKDLIRDMQAIPGDGFPGGAMPAKNVNQMGASKHAYRTVSYEPPQPVGMWQADNGIDDPVSDTEGDEAGNLFRQFQRSPVNDFLLKRDPLNTTGKVAQVWDGGSANPTVREQPEQAQQPENREEQEPEIPEDPHIPHVIQDHIKPTDEAGIDAAIQEVTQLFESGELPDAHIQLHMDGQNDHNPEVLRVAQVTELNFDKWHRDIGFPKSLELPSGTYQFTHITDHGIDEFFNDGRTHESDILPTSVSFEPHEIVEAKTTGKLPDMQIHRLLIRKNYDKKRDLVLSVGDLDHEKKQATLITAWFNDWDDDHRTLDVNEYRPGNKKYPSPRRFQPIFEQLNQGLTKDNYVDLKRQFPERFEKFDRRRQRQKAGNILDPIQPGLDPDIFEDAAGDSPRLKSTIAQWIKAKVHQTLISAGYDEPGSWLKLVLTGSLCTYQWSERSDFDVSLWVDLKVFPDHDRAELIALMIDKLDGTLVPGSIHPVQVFVVNSEEVHEFTDIYQPGIRSAWDIDSATWIVKPERERVRNVRQELPDAFRRAQQVAGKMRSLLQYNQPMARRYWDYIHARRRQDMKAGYGDFASSNISYKLLSNSGLFPAIENVTGQHIARSEDSDDGR